MVDRGEKGGCMRLMMIIKKNMRRKFTIDEDGINSRIFLLLKNTLLFIVTNNDIESND